jgi:hypothetical protein
MCELMLLQVVSSCRESTTGGLILSGVPPKHYEGWLHERFGVGSKT